MRFNGAITTVSKSPSDPTWEKAKLDHLKYYYAGYSLGIPTSHSYSESYYYTSEDGLDEEGFPTKFWSEVKNEGESVVTLFQQNDPVLSGKVFKPSGTINPLIDVSEVFDRNLGRLTQFRMPNHNTSAYLRAVFPDETYQVPDGEGGTETKIREIYTTTQSIGVGKPIIVWKASDLNITKIQEATFIFTPDLANQFNFNGLDIPESLLNNPEITEGSSMFRDMEGGIYIQLGTTNITQALNFELSTVQATKFWKINLNDFPEDIPR